MRRGLVAAMEREKLLAPVAVDDLGTNVEIDTIVDQVNLDQIVADDQSKKLDDSVMVAEALESIALSLETSSGLDGDGAKTLSTDLKQRYEQLGFIDKDQSVPALESFDATDSFTSTVIVLEGLRDTISKVWNAIIEMIKKSIAFISSLFEKVFGAATHLESRAKKLEKLVKDGKFEANPKESSIPNEKLFAALYIEKEVPVHIVEHVKTFAGVAEDIFRSTADFAEALASAMEREDLKDFSGAYEAFKKHFDFGNVEAKIDNPASFGYPTPAEGIVVEATPELLGGKTVVVYKPAKDSADSDAIIESLTHSYSSLIKYRPNEKEPEGKTVPTLSMGDVPHILTNVLAIVVELQHYKACLTKTDDAKRRVIRVAEKLSKGAVEETDSAKRQNMLALQRIGRGVVKFLDHPQSEFSTYTIRTCSALLTYVELSLKQYITKE
jgi:hypothetical protein